MSSDVTNRISSRPETNQVIIENEGASGGDGLTLVCEKLIFARTPQVDSDFGNLTDVHGPAAISEVHFRR